MSHTLGDTLVAELNERHAVVREMGKTVVLNEEWDHALGRRILTRSSFSSFKNFYANRPSRTPSWSSPMRLSGLRTGVARAH